jgi:hypothetical protein
MKNKELLLMIFYFLKKKPIKTFTFFFTKGIGTRKTFTIMCIIQSMLQHYIKEMIGVDPLKPKVVFNINGITILLTLGIPINKKIVNLMH